VTYIKLLPVAEPYHGHFSNASRYSGRDLKLAHLKYGRESIVLILE